MNVQSILLLAVVLVAAAYVFYRHLKSDGKCGCCDGCDCCSKSKCCGQEEKKV